MSESIDRRRLPKTPEHRAKISEALKRYAQREDSHLHALHKHGTQSPRFKTGIKPDYYRRIAFNAYGKLCNRCGRSRKEDGSPLYLVVHHRDDDRHNNEIGNLEVLCMSCHLRHHRSGGNRVGST